jgi:serine phosphatase RsbU (regulator of sigma subunit)
VADKVGGGGSSTRRVRIHARDKDFTLYLRPRGLFTVLAPAGRCTEAFLSLLLQDFLHKPDFLAADLSALDAVTLPFIRALRDYAAGLDATSGRLVLVNPPDKIRALLKLVDREGRVTLTASEKDLEGNLEEVEGRVRKAEDRVEVVRTMVASHPCWQLADREGRWLCPFCVTVRPEIRFLSRAAPTQALLGRVIRHLIEECTTYVDGAVDGWPFEVLERALRSTDAEEPPATPAAGAVDGVHSASASEAGEERRRRLLPRRIPPVDGFEIELWTRSARPLTGDFFDFLRLPDGRRGLLVGDVSGPGVDAGVLMGVARKTLAIRLRDTADAADALARANDDLCSELDGESFVSALLAVFDGAKRELVVARAGHPAPFLVRKAGGVERLEPPGPVLGFVPTASFDQGVEPGTFAVQAGDLLLVHTDGLEELRSAEGERFGAERIAEVLRGQAGQSAATALGALVLEAEQFAGPKGRSEDATAVCVRVL